MQKKDCLLCGVGGQGTILASKLIADAALLQGYRVRASETIGMSQRGGSVVSHVRVGENVHAPMIPFGSADVIIAFEPAEAVRALQYLSKDGVLVVSKKAVKPVTATLSASDYDGTEMIEYLTSQVSKLVVINTDEVLEKIGSSKVLNVVLLGAAAASGMLGFTLEQMGQAIEQRVPERFLELNRKALQEGAKIGGQI
ncbi:MAG: indolepyruvate oxidoreductase subunit beta [Clostridia bacterium]